jgi:cell division septum initiation protein DivIVA
MSSRLGELFDHVKTVAEQLIHHGDPQLNDLGHELAGKAHAAEQELVAQAEQVGHDASAGAHTIAKDAQAAADTVAGHAKSAAAPVEADAAHTTGQLVAEVGSDLAADAAKNL